MALVVAAMGARGPWKSLMRLMARLRRAAETKGSVGGAQLVAVLARDHVSDPVEAVLMAQWSRAQEATASGWAWSMGREQIRWTTSVVVVFFLALPLPPVLPRFAVVLVRLIRTTWAAPGKSIHSGASTAWTVRRTRLP